MKTFMIIVRCNNADELHQAATELVSEIHSNREAIDKFEVDEEWDITAGDADSITLSRTE